MNPQPINIIDNPLGLERVTIKTRFGKELEGYIVCISTDQKTVHVQVGRIIMEGGWNSVIDDR